MPLSDSELLNYSKEHLFYEIQMFFRLGWILVRLAAIPPIDSVGITIKNALIESFVTHLRNLGSFLSLGKAKFPGDVLAKDFFKQPAEWNPRIPTPLGAALKRSDKEVAHSPPLVLLERAPGRNGNLESAWMRSDPC
ncbi:MAG: hypothetical protein HY316_07810 [Acidobacteria bacterium]|nr:hypothetical protein [Acidobacteriota bacterium]